MNWGLSRRLRIPHPGALDLVWETQSKVARLHNPRSSERTLAVSATINTRRAGLPRICLSTRPQVIQPHSNLVLTPVFLYGYLSPSPSRPLARQNAATCPQCCSALGQRLFSLVDLMNCNPHHPTRPTTCLQGRTRNVLGRGAAGARGPKHDILRGSHSSFPPPSPPHRRLFAPRNHVRRTCPMTIRQESMGDATKRASSCPRFVPYADVSVRYCTIIRLLLCDALIPHRPPIR